MSADDAFDNLMQKNALTIPLAKPGPKEAEALLNSVRPVHPGEDGAVRVMNLLDQVPSGDYNPRYEDENGTVYATPTETDLDPVPGAGEEAADFLAGLAGDEPQEFSEVEEPSPADSYDAGLDQARRLRRFAYLPVTGMDHFENRARDIMAGITSQFPDRPSLAITSPARGDGQTELAIRLALAAAKRVDYRVLLVDFDIRKPQIAPRLGLGAKYFVLGDVLRSSCLLGEALIYSEEDNLYVLPARPSDREGDEVLADRQVQTLLAGMHATFDFTVISCGPMDHVDATIICRHAGTTALAGFCNHTSAQSMREAADGLTEAGVNVAGLLLTGA
ncbi:MAG: hypothetical protein LUE17_02245 [Planctomycetaceae bacterium]|nr:hypothetical protein [Planctomycetaceae bacterium]